MTARLTLLTRDACELCEEFLAQLQSWYATRPDASRLPALEVRDVDEDPELQRRHGLEVPVLLWDGVRIGAGRLDHAELERLFRRRESL